MPSAILCFDASPAIGGGHAVRCLTLADALSAVGWTCELVVGPETVSTVPAVGQSGHSVVELDAIEGATSRIEASAPDLVVVDHYRLDGSFEAVGRAVGARVLVIDDLANRSHDCDLLLDPTPGRSAGEYAGLVPSGCRTLMGPDYALVRPQFRAQRRASNKRRTGGRVQRILINMGATDAVNCTRLALDAISQAVPHVDVDLLLGATAPHLRDLQAYVDTFDDSICLHVGIENVAELMSAADIAIGAGGTSSYERCAVGLPTLLIITADNQSTLARGLEALGAVENLGSHEKLDAAAVAGRLADLCGDHARCEQIAKRAADLCDARGATRVLLELVEPTTTQDGRSVRLRLVSAEDEQIMLEWQRHPSTRRFARNPQVPTEAEHHAWLSEQLVSVNAIPTLIEHGGVPAGVLRFKQQEGAAQSAVYRVSILVAPEHRRTGLALAALRMGRQVLPGAELTAETLPGNHASAALFEAATYQREEDGLFHSHPISSSMTQRR